MNRTRAKILSNERIMPDRFVMRLDAPSIAKSAKPGQFIMVKCNGGTEPLLRRPLSLHRIEKKRLSLLYQVVGGGTRILSKRKRREELDIIGPLGNGFNIDKSARLINILIGGGIGVAPLLALAEELKIRRLKTMVLIGAKTRSHLVGVEQFKALGIEVRIATEDGSKGYKGFATDLLKDEAIIGAYEPAMIYACGPKDMLMAAAGIARINSIECQVSFEERMACGTGVCLGCAVNTVKGIKMACKDGPVFNAEDIIWQK
ncbi:MAG: dihydroorotate dehydrogenase electron transfer subunit [Candidatus Omnitrophica bacterium]|nr:dihydroorotate dehydrogenase electron transfer subunit [Candidatus Omnitrophota bacterium]